MIRLARFIAKNPGLFRQGMRGYREQRLSPRLNQIILQYVNRTKMVSLRPWKKLGTFSAGFPLELPLSFGFFPGYPEAYAALTGAAGCTQQPIEHAESLGYSRDLCSYMKTSIGASRKKWPEDFGGCKTADAYFSANLVCDTHLKWMENEAKIFGRPHFALDVPSCVSGTGEERLEEYIDYVEQQLWDLAGFLEKITGKKFNEKKFLKIVDNSAEICRLFRELSEYRKRFPANSYFEWVRSFMLPMVTQWNQGDAIRYYSSQLKKARRRYKNETAISPGREKYRVLWEGITIWYKVDLYSKMLAEKGARIVMEPYTYSFAGRSRPGQTVKETFRRIARDLIIVPFTLNIEERIKYFKGLIDEYHLDGIILHANQSCRPSSTGLYDLQEALQEESDVPVLMLYSDHCDPRVWSEGAVATRIDGFVEMMENRKSKKTGG